MRAVMILVSTNLYYLTDLYIHNAGETGELLWDHAFILCGMFRIYMLTYSSVMFM